MAWTTPRTWAPGELVTATLLNQHVRDNLISVLPVGSLIYRVAARTAVETLVENRFLECNGVAVSRTTYATLFNHLNAMSPALPFGVGNGTTTFHLPDLSGRMPIMLGTHTDVDALGDSEGAALAERTPFHRHTSRQYQFSGSAGNVGIGSAFNSDVTDNSSTGAIGPASAGRPLDTPAFLVAGVWYIKCV